MQTNIINNLLSADDKQIADDVLRSCVHCGFCLSTCPTYKLLGSELDSPRGRIYIIKNALETNNTLTNNSLIHLDRCLTCKSCETACPSGVQYTKLLKIGRELLEPTRSILQKTLRFIIRKTLTNSKLFSFIAIFVSKNRKKLKIIKPIISENKILLLAGCVQPSLAPNINLASKQVLTKLGYSIIETKKGECCGAIDEHLSASKDALVKIKNNLNNWCEQLDLGAKYIVSTASGCGAMIKDYSNLFKTDDEYFHKAKRVVNSTKDIAEILLMHKKNELQNTFTIIDKDISLHTPCTLYHSQGLPKIIHQLFNNLDITLNEPKDSDICCGSAGTYSILQSKISKQLLTNKLDNITKNSTDIIITANIGCLMHLQKGTKIPVKHWIELLADYK